MNSKPGCVLIMAGGTGGHVFPALAVARELINRGVRVVWLGTRRGLETRAVPASGLPIELKAIAMRGLRHTGVLNWLLLPFTLPRAMLQAFTVMRRCRPNVAISFGGYVAGPGGLVAMLTGTPLLIHEANAVPGFTNKWLALFARQILTGFPNGFISYAHARQVGNPVRAEIARIAAPEVRLANRSGRLRVLVVGGSQGARVFNEVMPQAIKLVPPALRPDIRHQCGRNQHVATYAAYGGARAEVFQFIDNMADAYAWADIVVSRAGAMTVTELAAAGCCSVLVPFPGAVDDHQTANARYLVSHDAAVLMPQMEFTPVRIATLLQELAPNRELIVKMAVAARGVAITDAADAVASACEEVIRE
ncbi:MAG TPA: undecaprenyldiphospho-muramoylpentapeptide beta-N-acetylglucosaminyltransferase [Burkholderiaceae bacterium]|nr:undecaprenyldiphospho-muramoylpentapeptide beta-N-acetylglucosaminyltransferase [Burkholderiaceae bacterium]